MSEFRFKKKNNLSFSSKILIPQIVYADSTINTDEDDALIDPTNERLDGQFDDITSSTNIIQPIL